MNRSPEECQQIIDAYLAEEKLIAIRVLHGMRWDRDIYRILDAAGVPRRSTLPGYRGPGARTIPDLDARIAEAHGRGLTDYAIAAELGVMRQLVQKHRRRMGLPVNPQRRRAPAGKIAQRGPDVYERHKERCRLAAAARRQRQRAGATT